MKYYCDSCLLGRFAPVEVEFKNDKGTCPRCGCEYYNTKEEALLTIKDYEDFLKRDLRYYKDMVKETKAEMEKVNKLKDRLK